MKAILILSIVFLTSCTGSPEPKGKPLPVKLGENEVGYYMMMIVADHAGPKAQLWLKDKQKPIWFVDVRDAIKFTRTPEEPDNISAIYVHDMAKNPDYQHVKDIWVELDKAVFVINSRKKGGMGMPETIPFSDEQSAQAFINENGGELIKSVTKISTDYLNPMGEMQPMDSVEMMQHNLN